MFLEKKDFVEIEFTGKIKNGEIFDSNIKEELEKLNPEEEAKPLIICLGEGIFLKGVEDFLIGKKIGEYNIELPPENAFGLRNPSLVQVVPSKIFTSQKLNPIPGSVFNLDGRIAKVLSYSGGRVVIDFNHPLAGKYVEYTIRVLRKIDDLNEKIKALINLFFKKDLKYSLKDKELTIYVEKELLNFVLIFKDKFKELLDLELEVKESNSELHTLKTSNT
ncbi:peptidylprolyl isomerase [Candidatus Woesearchaeota archaeon]|nr:peptidylprolyl isomerase [Candidatus Woesearchaeota archaeon]